MRTEQGEALATCAEEGRVDLGACSGSEHLQLRGWCVSGRAGLSVPLPQGSKSSPALRCLTTAQCPQEASQADRFTPPRTVWPGWPATKGPRLQRGPKRPPAWAAAPIHRSQEQWQFKYSCLCCSSLSRPLFIKCPQRTSFHGAVYFLLTRTVKWLPPQPPSQISGRWRP